MQATTNPVVKKEPVPKPPKVPRPPAPRTVYGTHASARVRVQLGCHKKEGEGEGVKEEEVVVRDEEEEMTEDEVRKNLEHDYMEELLLQEEQKLQDYETKQDEFDQEALRNVNTLYANVQTQESVAANISNKGEIGFRLDDYEAEELWKQLAEPIVAVTLSTNHTASTTHITNKGKQVAEPQGKKKGSKIKAPTSSEEAVGNQRIIFHKNNGRSERIFNQKIKKSSSGPHGKGSTPDKAFSLT
nr:chloramphenicol acetyltransferase-like domain-containing protein [Tanacetum cinerariifolium]